MKQNEIIERQDRVIYILLVIVGALGLAWAIWKHLYAPRQAAPASHASVAPHRAGVRLVGAYSRVPRSA